MMTLGLMAAGIAAVAIWTYLLAAHGNFWRISTTICRLPTAPSAGLAANEAKIVAVIPARNEAEGVAHSITSLLAHSGSTEMRVFLVDDGSTDGTAEVARAAAENIGKGVQLTVIAGEPLPPGWSGKLWAVRQGVDRAQEFNPDFLLLTDADVALAPDDLNALVAIARDGSYDLASLMVRLHCCGIAEKLLIPAFVFFFFKLYPPRWISDPARATAGAAGGCMLVRPEALRQAGGIEAIRNEVIDDCALASLLKHSGKRAWLGLASRSASIRPYGSFAEIGRMISRSAFNQLRHSALLLLGVLAGMTLMYLLPLILLLTWKPLAIALGLAAWVMMTVAYLPMVRYYEVNALWALSLPLAAVFYAGATVHSAVKYWLGRGGVWKGRVQDPTIKSPEF